MHPEMIERMTRALDKELPGEDTRLLQTHLLECATCAGEWAALLAVHQQLSNARMLSPTPGFANRVMNRIAARGQKRAQRQSLVGVFAFLVGSVAVFALTVYLSPLGELWQTGGWVELVNEVIVWLAFLSALTRVANTLGLALLERSGEGALLLMAFVAFGLTFLWARLVSGSAFASRQLKT